MTTDKRPPPDLSLHIINRYITALRPWTWTASIVPILVTSALVSSTSNSLKEDDMYYYFTTVRLLVSTILVQSAANAINTCEDFKKGVDTEKQEGGDRSLVDRRVTYVGLSSLGYGLLCISVYFTLNFLSIHSKRFDEEAWKAAGSLFVAGTTIAVMYTAPPLRLKYNALGDVAVITAFGPVLMQFVAVVLTGEYQSFVYYYTVPVGILTDCILHANNARDIDNDKNAGITTVATLLGFNASKILYKAMIFSVYVFTLMLAKFGDGEHAFVGQILVLVTIPIAFNLIIHIFTKENIINADEETAKFHLLFGISMAVGIKYVTPFIQEHL